MTPADDALGIEQEIRAVREEAFFVQHAIAYRHLALEVAQQIDLHVVLLLVFLERVDRVDADWQSDHAALFELRPIVTHLAELGGAGGGKCERKECDQNRLPAELRQRDTFARGRWESKIRRKGAELRRCCLGRIRGRGHSFFFENRVTLEPAEVNSLQSIEGTVENTL